MVKRVLSGAAEKRTPRWSIDPGNKANLGETRTAEVERFEKAPATTFPHGPAAVELPPNCHGGGPPNQRWRLTARLHESGRPGSNRRRPAWEAFLALAGQGFFGSGSRNGITQYADVGVAFGNFTFASLSATGRDASRRGCSLRGRVRWPRSSGTEKPRVRLTPGARLPVAGAIR